MYSTTQKHDQGVISPERQSQREMDMRIEDEPHISEVNSNIYDHIEGHTTKTMGGLH